MSNQVSRDQAAIVNLDDFVQAIIADPDDDSARLIFADYLEEQGDPRGEMIRLQMQLAEMSPLDRARPRLRKRELALLKQHGGFGTVPPGVIIREIHGGFVDCVEVTVARFLKLQDEIFSGSPVRSLIIRNKSTRFERLCESPHLHRIRHLTLKNNKATEQQMRRLVSHPALHHLQSLSVRDWESTYELGMVIANQPALAGLRHLTLAMNASNSGKAIATSPVLTHLETLRLVHQDDGGLLALSTSPNCRVLKELQLSGMFSANAVARFQSGPYCRRLENLSLRTYNADAPHCFDVPMPLEDLKHLEFGGGHQQQILIDICKNYPELKTLNLAGNRIGDQAIDVLCNSPLLASLQKLVLTSNSITVKGIEALATSPLRPKGLKLYLRNNSIKHKELQRLKETYGRTFGNLGNVSKSWLFRT